MKRNKFGIIFFCAAFLVLLLIACNKFEYSPYQIEETNKSDSPNSLNDENLAKLMASEKSADDTVTIAFSGDSQRFYDELEDLVYKVNTIPNIDFFVLAGDIADFGVLNEYLWTYEQLKKLKIPYLCTIGNHDLAADKGKAYEEMFGKKNYAFTYKKYKFLFHDTNGREYDFDGNAPNLWWLSGQLSDTIPKWFIGVSHVPPFDEDFDRNLEISYKNLFASTPGFILSLHGHKHSGYDDYFYKDSIRYMCSNYVKSKILVVLKFVNGKVFKQVVFY
jgi:3',5'-cyclic-AMP phosphodiesterase